MLVCSLLGPKEQFKKLSYKTYSENVEALNLIGQKTCLIKKVILDNHT